MSLLVSGDVVDRVLVRLTLGQIEIEIQMLIALAQHVKKPRRVVADFPTQVAQCDELSGARGHRRLLAVAVEHGELHQGDREAVGIEAGVLERLDARIEALLHQIGGERLEPEQRGA